MIQQAHDHILVIFGASGDLTERKLIPSIYNLYTKKLLPNKFAILGVSRTEYSDDAYRDKLIASLEKETGKDKSHFQDFLKLIYYQAINTQNSDDYANLRIRLEKLAKTIESSCNYLFYLSTPPSLYEPISRFLKQHGMTESCHEKSWKRIIIEKPFGYDLASAIELNHKIHDYFNEDQIYRIDHYLGKETVQNIMVTRFVNGFFEPLWNRNFIDRVEITAAESLGVEGRGGYYDHSGALRDMIQNHLLQTAAFIAMEPPASLDATSIRNEIMKVFQSIRPYKDSDIETHVIRGQYTESNLQGKVFSAYRNEQGVDPNSKTETYVALKLFIDNWRWGNVPFYIRTGKRLPTRVSEIAIHFKTAPHQIFYTNPEIDKQINQLIIRIQPDEGILFKFGMKVPGAGFMVQPVNMDFKYADLSDVNIPSAYERLILDCMNGDATLYSRGDAVEATWKFLKPVQEAWENNKDMKIFGYPSGTWGPEAANELFNDKNTTWRYPCKNLTNDGQYCEL